MTVSLELIPGYDRPEEILSLFTEYTHMLVSHDPSFQIYLDIQHYDDEIRDRPSTASRRAACTWPCGKGRPPVASPCGSWMNSAAR